MDQFRGLFVKLDQNNDGFISLSELHREMSKHGILAADAKVQNVIDSYDNDNNGVLDYDEFLSYMMDREKNWKIYFHHLDKNKCGVIDQEDIICLFKELGVLISKANAKKVIQMMDTDNSMTVDWDEFLQHVILKPVDTIGELVSSWKHSLVFNVGESRALAIEFPEDNSGVGAWRTFVLGAGLADAVSRTATAPIDRLKTQLQVLKVRLNLQRVGTNHGVVACARSIYRHESLSSFYRGFKPSILCMIPYAGVECAVHQSIVNWAQSDPTYSSDSMLFFFSFVAFACGQMTSYPLAVIRTQQQAQAFSSHSQATSGVLQGLLGIYQKHGLRGYYNGMGASFVRAVPCALMNLILTRTFENLFSSTET
ncbi:solute carrier family 25 member 24, like isoform X3 [Dunckerocampus dactyliophorus]|uniref:solute carrier family 25 member 24, like isoform X3 n=1 Tax=Dunckerocampus dactyliophorus TaxID=161453 RepID=UPI0024063FC1|nr:solute carrier family 25 member 24, like isoform X3 [Dunckerocampus dactyliophorus]